MTLDDVLEWPETEVHFDNNHNGIINGTNNIGEIKPVEEIFDELHKDCDCDFCYFANEANFAKPEAEAKAESNHNRFFGYSKIATGVSSGILAGASHFYYYWSHDFAHGKIVSVPLWYPELQFTGYEWEVLNWFSGEVAAILFMAGAGCLLAQGIEQLDNVIDENKDLSRRENAKNRELIALIEKCAPKLEKVAEKINAKYSRPEDKDILISKEEEEKIYAKKHPWRTRLEKIFSKPAAVPVAIAAHTAYMFAVFNWWYDAYFNKKTFLSKDTVNITEGMAWNYGVIPSLITLMIFGATIYYFWRTPIEKQTKKYKT